MGNGLNETRQVYESLWNEAASAFERNDPELDPICRTKAGICAAAFRWHFGLRRRSKL